MFRPRGGSVNNLRSKCGRDMRTLMSSQSTTFSKARPRTFQAIAWGGLITGVLDITAALVNWGVRGVGPVRILQGIASGILGQSSFDGGLKTAALGLACHFFIATTATAVYYAASRRLAFLTQQAVLAGALYGVTVYLFMNWIVLPLSAARATYSFNAVVVAVLIHIFFVGLPISLTVRHFSR